MAELMGNRDSLASPLQFMASYFNWGKKKKKEKPKTFRPTNLLAKGRFSTAQILKFFFQIHSVFSFSLGFLFFFLSSHSLLSFIFIFTFYFSQECSDTMATGFVQASMHCVCGLAYFHGVNITVTDTNTPFRDSLPCVSMCKQTLGHQIPSTPLSHTHAFTCAHARAHTHTPEKPPFREKKRCLEKKTPRPKNIAKNSPTY